MLELRWSNLEECFFVSVDGVWAGTVWPRRGVEWASQDWDGDVDGGFATAFEAAEHVRSMLGGRA
jgi:hypothetical protein